MMNIAQKTVLITGSNRDIARALAREALSSAIAGLFFILFHCSLATGQTLAIEAAKVYPTPDAKPLLSVTVLIRDGEISAIGRNVAIPKGARILRCLTCTVFAGFWNTHVHFMEPKWMNAATLPATQLAKQLQEMLTTSGFTTVVDIGSDPVNTIALRQRIESGEVPGPRIYTAGLPLFPPNALPYYLRDLPPEYLSRLPQPRTTGEAADAVELNIAKGTDIVKLFTGSIVSSSQVVPMPVEEARAAVEAAHSHHQLVFAHASNLAGVKVALSAGVDVIAHAPESTSGALDDAFLRQLVDSHMVIIPTLMLFAKDSDIGAIRDVVRRFHALGGQLMFGTDTGFLTDYDLKEEYRQLALTGLGFRDVVAMLTTNPAQRFGVERREGRVAAGMEGNLTILAKDPAVDGPVSMTEVRYTIRQGRVIYDGARLPIIGTSTSSH
jgi:imidazolonepropionase-like amidohydrolase